MLDFEDDLAKPVQNTALEGEILGSLSTWTAEYDLERLDLAYDIMKVLLDFLYREHPPHVVAEFCENISGVLDDQAKSLNKILEEVRLRRLN